MSASHVPRTIIVPLDGDAAHQPVVAVAESIARRMNGAVELVSIITEGGLVDVDAASLDEQAESGAFGVSSRAIIGTDVVSALEDEMASRSAIVCLASSGRSAVVETLLGSVSASLIRRSKAPMVIVGPQCGAFAGSQLAIAVDGTVAGEWIIEPALALADALGLDPVLYQVSSTIVDSSSSDREVSAYLRHLAGRFERPKGPVQCEILHDRRIGRALADLSAKADVAILALGSHALQPYERLLLPSVAHHLIRHAACPLFVGSREVPAEPVFDHGSDVRVVVGVDGSSADEGALEYAVDAAIRRGATLEIVHAWPRSWYLSNDGSIGGKSAAVAEVEAEEVLHRAVGLAEGFDATVRILPWLAGTSPSDALLDAGASAALIVLGEHRYNMIESVVLGSTTTDVLDRSTTPVIVVPEADPTRR